jgi:excinuclease UvrABC nuclease subunit
MNENELLQKASQFLSRVSGLAIPTSVHVDIRDLRQTPSWGEWSRKPGVYYFVYHGEVVYVGRAYPSVNVGNRVGTHINDYNNPAWAEVIRDEDTTVGVLSFPVQDWHWLAALEVWLIDNPRPKFNMRF